MPASHPTILRIVGLLLGSALRLLAAAQDTPEVLPPLIYVPYDHLPESVLGASVLMPYEHYLQSWTESTVQPPVPAVLSSFSLSGSLGEETCSLTFSAQLRALAPSWSHIDLPTDLPLTAFSASDPRVTLERAVDGVHLHLPGEGSYQVTAQLLYPVIHGANGTRSVVLSLPIAAAGTLDLHLPDDISGVQLVPLVAQLASTGGSGGAGRQLHCALGGAAQVTLSWQPPVASAGKPLVLAQEDVLMRCSDRAIEEEVALRLTISRQPVQECTITIPEAMQLLAVDGPYVLTWDAQGARVHLRFASPQDVEARVHLRLSQALPALPPGQLRAVSVGFPALTLAERTSGSLVVSTDDTDPVTIAIDGHDGMSQVDPSRLGVPTASAAFTFLAQPPALALRLTRESPEIRAHIHQLLQLGTQADAIVVTVGLEVRRAGIYGVSLLCPGAWQLVEAHGSDVSIDDSRMGALSQGQRHLQISFKNRLLGSAALRLQFQSPASIPHAPAAALPIGVLQVLEVDAAAQTQGQVAVVAPVSWEISTAQRSALVEADVHALATQGSFPSLLAQTPADAEPVLGFTWAQGQGESGPNPPPSAALLATARTRELTLRVADAVTVADGVVRESVTWHGQVRYSAIPAFRVVVPSAWDHQVVFHGSGIAERTMVAHSATDATTTWEVRFEQPVLGGFTCVLEHATPLPAAAAGAVQSLTLEPIREFDATRIERVLAVSREGTLEVTATDPGMTAVAPGDVPSELQHEGVVAAFQGASAGTLALTVVHRDDVRLADAAVSLAQYQAVLGEDGVLQVHATVQLESHGRPALEMRLPDHAELLELAIDQHQGHPSRREDGTIIVPLPAVSELSTLQVAYVYTLALADGRLPRSGELRVQLPTMGDDVHALPLPVQQVSVSLYLPALLVPGRWRGDLTPVDAAGISPAGSPEDDGLTVHVTTSGVRSDFSRLGGGGEIRVAFVQASALWMIACVLALLGVMALWLLRRYRWAALGMAIMGVLLLAGLALATSLAWAGSVVGITAISLALVAWQASRPWRHQRRAWRSTEALVSDDPWLEPAAPHPPTPPSSSPPPPAHGDGSGGAPTPPQDPT